MFPGLGSFMGGASADAGTETQPAHTQLPAYTRFGADFGRLVGKVKEHTEGMHDRRMHAINVWHQAPDDEKEKEFNFLAAVLEAAAGLALGQLGKWVAGKITAKIVGFAGKTVPRLAEKSNLEKVVAGALGAGVEKGVSAAKSGIKGSFDAASQAGQANAMLYFFEGRGLGLIQEKEAQVEAFESLLYGADEETGWFMGQQLCDALAASKIGAYDVELYATIDSWFTELASAKFGEDSDGTVSADNIAGDWGTSSLGTLGIHAKELQPPGKPLQPKYIEFEGSKGNTEFVRNALLSRPGNVADWHMPKLIIAEQMSTQVLWQSDLIG
ncbi:MAG: hypothetical protein JRJ84_24830, partial [Deltaproteobacteria bacterium]|nr:hypothetical protein [Deltaproteobacteria bacterium]